MRSVSSRFLAALKSPHKLVSDLTYTVPGQGAVGLAIQSGSVTADAGNRIRRTATLTVYGSSADYRAMVTPGTVFHIDHGLDYGGQTEMVPVFHGEQVDGEQRLGDGTIQLSLADHGNWLDRCRFTSPYAPQSYVGRMQAISDIVTTAKPGTSVVITASDTGTVGSQNVWTDSRLDAIQQLCSDAAADAFFGPDGVFYIVDAPSDATQSVWTVSGLVESAARKRPSDRLYNTVVVQPSATDGSQTWKPQTVQLTDTSNPRHPNYIGVVPYFWSSPTITNAAAAKAAGAKILYRVLGSTETLNLGLVSNPALEPNDVFRVVVPAVNGDPADIFQHFIDRFTLDLVTGAMSVDTRSQAVSTT